MAFPVASQTSLDDPLDARDAKRLDRMEKVMRELRAIVFQSQRQSGVPIVVQPADTDARLQSMADRVGDLETTLQRLNGSLEAVTRDLDESRRENTTLKEQVTALNARLTAPPPPPEGASMQGGFSQGDPQGAPQENPEEAFAAARQQMLGGDYDGAEIAFARFVGDYPDSPRSAEARYWWGKTLAVRGQDSQAATAFIGAIRGWPQTGWAPDAVVELSRSLVTLGKSSDACQTLTELSRRYPKATSAVKTRAAATAARARCT